MNLTKPSSNLKMLILLNNHVSHLPLNCTEYCRDNGVELSFHPLCCNRLQPLDCSVFGLKHYINKAMDHWKTNCPATPMSIYAHPSIMTITLLSAKTPANIMAGFRCTGIFPLYTHCPAPVMQQEAVPPVAPALEFTSSALLTSPSTGVKLLLRRHDPPMVMKSSLYMMYLPLHYYFS